MSCKHQWDRIFIFKSLPAAAVYGPLKKHREALLFEREKLRLPEVQPLVCLMKKGMEYDAEIKQIQNQVKVLNKIYHEMKRTDEARPDVLEKIEEAKEKARHIKEKRFAVWEEQQQIEIQIDQEHRQSLTETKVEQSVLCACPGEDCRGFILKGQGHVCGVCSTEICKHCHSILAPEHTCKPEDVESVKHILNECKSCPGCGIPCRKTEGCSQVWCLMCHKAWNWETGVIEKGRIHATDYLNYVRREGREVPRFDVNAECGLHVHIVTIFRMLKRRIANSDELITENIQQYLLYRYQIMAEYEEFLTTVIVPTSTLNLRVKYLMGEITEARFKQQLHKLDKEFTFKQELHCMECAYTLTIRDALIELNQASTLNVQNPWAFFYL